MDVTSEWYQQCILCLVQAFFNRYISNILWHCILLSILFINTFKVGALPSWLCSPTPPTLRNSIQENIGSKLKIASIIIDSVLYVVLLLRMSITVGCIQVNNCMCGTISRSAPSLPSFPLPTCLPVPSPNLLWRVKETPSADLRGAQGPESEGKFCCGLRSHSTWTMI